MGITHQSTEKHDPYKSLRYRDFQYHMFGALLGSLAYRMQSAAVGWDIYTRTNSALALGFVGLAQALPVLLFALPAGQITDRLDRRRIVILTSAIQSLLWIGLYFVSSHHAHVSAFYALLFLGGIANSIVRPARNSLVTQLVPLAHLPNAITWNSSRTQISAMVGPALGGLAISALAGPARVYVIAALLGGIYVFCVILMHPRPQEISKEKLSWQSVSYGARFVFQNKLLLAPLTLDMLGVLFGGAEALMPIFAKDILHAGSTGYGLLLAAPGVGAVLTLFLLAYVEPIRRAGKVLLWAVAGYGIAMVIFGISKIFWLSMAMLFIAGGLDSISVMIRHTLVQVITPDYLRGRVSAINGLFIGVSNELGGFESGTVAKLIGPILTVILGGISTIVVVAGVAFKWHELRELDTLEQAATEAKEKYAGMMEVR